MSRDAVYLMNAILNIVNDLVILLLRRSLYKPLRQSVLAAVMFGVGSLSVPLAVTLHLIPIIECRLES